MKKTNDKKREREKLEKTQDSDDSLGNILQFYSSSRKRMRCCRSLFKQFSHSPMTQYLTHLAYEGEQNNNNDDETLPSTMQTLMPKILLGTLQNHANIAIS